jgi:plasmid stabilization system protein ParE
MSFELIFRIEAEKDLADIQEYYSQISDKVTSNFFKEFFHTISFIEKEPQLFQVRYRGIRIAPMYQYPYGIHYIQKNDQVIVFRVLHTKRYFK